MKLLSLILTPLFYLYYLLIFLVWHPIILIAHKGFGDKGRHKVVAVLNFFLTKALYILGTRVRVKGKENMAGLDCPVIVVSNHQAFYDIPILGYFYRKHKIDYVAKLSLGKGIPTISYNLSKGQSALVDRDSGGQSVREIFKMGRHIEAENATAVIFPEGTRSKTGELQEFMPAGVATLLRAAPSAVVQPVAIKGHSNLNYPNSNWAKPFQKVEYTILPVIDPKGKDVEELVAEVRKQIAAAIQ